MRLKFLGKKLSNVQYKGVRFDKAGDEREMVDHDARLLLQIHPDEFVANDSNNANKQLSKSSKFSTK